MIIPRRLPIPKPVPVPLFGPPRQRVVDPDQTDIVEYLEAHPPTASAEPPAVESQPMPAGLRALRVSVADPDDLPEHEIPARPASRTAGAPSRPAPRIPFINEIAILAKALFGPKWIGRAAKAVQEHERQVRRWVSGESRPSAAHLDKMRDEAEARHSELTDALRLAGRLPPAEAPALKATDAPHVGRGQTVAEALARHVELRKAALVHPPQAAREGPAIDKG